MPEKVRVGLVGCGAISSHYLNHAKNFPIFDIVACADINTEAAKKKAQEFAIAKVMSVEELIRDESVEVVLNLTVPKAHAPIALAAIEAGKHTYAEKPLGIDRDEAKKVMEAAKKRHIKVGCAPDTVLPYYLTALLNLLGPVQKIGGMATIAVPERTITSEPKKGKKITVETPDHIFGTMQFKNGAIGMIGMSFAVRFGTHDGKAPITIFGTKGTMKVPDPNGFDGEVWVRTDGDEDWRQVPHTFPTGYGRAVGLADMAYAIRSGRKFRCNGQQALVVVDLMEGFLDSAESGRAYTPKVKYERPALMPADLPFGTLDE